MPIYVATLEDLNNVRNNRFGEYIQTADIDASPTSDPESAYWNDGAGWEPIGTAAAPFAGSYDGGGFVIDGLFINRGSSTGIGLFGEVMGGALTNVAVTNGNVTGQQRVGLVVGGADHSTVNDCWSNGSVSSAYNSTVRIGGVAGSLQEASSASGCHSSATISCPNGERVGGCFGQIWSSSSALKCTVSGCYATGDVHGERYAGGFVGQIVYGVLHRCYATGYSLADWAYSGGLAGIVLNSSSINDSYAQGTAQSDNYTGGLVGSLSLSTITNCYSTGVVTGRLNSGGLVGGATSATATACYWDTQTSGRSTSARGTGKTTAQMQDIATYAAWDIERVSDVNPDDPSIWSIFDTDGVEYPQLYWSLDLEPCDISYTADINLFDYHITSYSDSLLYTRNSLSYNNDIDIVQDTLYTADILLSKHWRVKDTGDSSFDGIYTEEGEVNGEVYYTHGSGADKRYLYFDPPAWGLTKDSEFTASSKEYIDHDKLPGNPWSPINDGVEPAPTVAELQEDKYYSNVLIYEIKDTVYNSNIIILKTENTTLLSDISVKDTYNSSFNTDVFLKAIVTVSYAPASANGNSSNQQMMFF